MKLNRITATMAAMALLAAACGSADTTVAAAPDPAQADEQSAAIEITATDFTFEGLPSSIRSGTGLTLTNSSDVELHELVAIPLPDDETRSMVELIADPEALPALFGSVETVILAPPTEAGFPVVGTGALTTPGRYAIICAIPIGADPAEYLAAAAESDGPPQVEGGPPHFTAGMYAEVIVEAG